MRELISYRRLSGFEADLLKHIFSLDFPGREVLLMQLEGANVKSECETCPTVEFFVADSFPRADVKRRIPVEAQGNDLDGIKIHFLLHVVAGFISELEIFREDSNPIMKMPEISSLKVMSLDTDGTW